MKLNATKSKNSVKKLLLNARNEKMITNSAKKSVKSKMTSVNVSGKRCNLQN